jgi:hypothetical protein
MLALAAERAVERRFGAAVTRLDHGIPSRLRGLAQAFESDVPRAKHVPASRVKSEAALARAVWLKEKE